MPLNFVSEPIREISVPSCGDLVLDRRLVARRQRAVLVLDGQLADAAEHRVHLAERTFRGLHERDGVAGVALGLAQTADLTPELLRDREAGGVVGSPVDPEARREPLHRLRRHAGGAVRAGDAR